MVPRAIIIFGIVAALGVAGYLALYRGHYSYLGGDVAIPDGNAFPMGIDIPSSSEPTNSPEPSLSPEPSVTPVATALPDKSSGYVIASSLLAEYSQFISTMKDCITKLGNDKGICADNYARAFLAVFSTKDALSLLQRGMDSDPNVLIQCHDMAHAVGRETLSFAGGKVDEAFNACDQTCHSGCYHGAMERVFIPAGASAEHVSEADLKAKVPSLCEVYDGQPARFKFQCLHGIGHAIMFILENDLEKSLGVCDLMSVPYDRGSCWGGAFMENVTSFDRAARWIRPADPHYPCNALDLKYQQTCYMMQTSIMYELGLTPGRIAEECRRAGIARLDCFQSLGRDISTTTRTNMAHGVSVCAPMVQDEREACVRGIVYAFIDLTWDGSYAFRFCDALPEAGDQEFCYRYSVRYLRSGLGLERDGIQNMCVAQSKHQDVCESFVD